MNLSTLVREGVAHIAQLPPSNWRDIATARFLSVPLIAEDYPAKTAAMWNAAYAALGMPDRNMMLVADPKDLNQIMPALRADPRYQGGGVGIGFKEAVLPYLDDITPLARAMGAVNIIKKDGQGRLVGDNTDGAGYARSLEEALAKNGIAMKDAHILMLGAGGSGRAIAFALADKGARLTILNRTEAKAQELSDTLNRYFGRTAASGGSRKLLSSVIVGTDAIVSVIDDAVSPLDAYSTIGVMELPVTRESIERNRIDAEHLLGSLDRKVVISDIRIRKGPTAMLSQAKELGFRTLDGIPMVVNQGVDAFRWLYDAPLALRIVDQADIPRIMRTAAAA